MGKIILTVEGTTVGTVAEGRGIQIVREVSEQDSARLLMAYAAIYGDQWVDESGTPFQPTYDQIIAAWFDGIIAGSVASVRSHEQEVAAQRAKEEVTDLVVTAA